MNLHDLTGTDCCPSNIPGYESTLWIVPACEINEFPARGEYSSSPGASVTIASAITLKTEKKFLTIPIMIDSGGTLSTAQGNQGSRGFRNEVSFSIQGNTDARLSWAERVLNGCYVAILKDKMGRMRIIGTKESPAVFEKIEVMNNSEDSKATYLLYDTIGKIAPIYTSTIDIDDAT